MKITPDTIRTSRFMLLVLPLLIIVIGNLTFFPAVTASTEAAPVSPTPPDLEVFGTGIGRPQTLIPSETGDYYVVDTDAKIWGLPETGGIGTLLATPGYSLRDGVFLPRHFGPKAGQFLILGGVATTNTPALASIMDDSHTVSPYATQPSSLWSAAIIPTGFGQYTRGVLVVNQGSGQSLKNGSVDYFAPDGSVGRVADLSDMNVPYGGVMVVGFGDVSGTLLVSDARSGEVHSVKSDGQVSLFTTIPLGAGQTGLRQMAFSPHGWGNYSRHLFVSLLTGEVAVVNKDGIVVGKIAGFTTPRGLRFTEIDGLPVLLIADTGNSTTTPRVWKAGPEDIVPVP